MQEENNIIVENSVTPFPSLPHIAYDWLLMMSELSLSHQWCPSQKQSTRRAFYRALWHVMSWQSQCLGDVNVAPRTTTVDILRYYVMWHDKPCIARSMNNISFFMPHRCNLTSIFVQPCTFCLVSDIISLAPKFLLISNWIHLQNALLIDPIADRY